MCQSPTSFVNGYNHLVCGKIGLAIFITLLMPLLSCFCFHSFQEVFNYKIAARPERRRQFEKELTSQIEVALNILTACLKISELKEQVKTVLCCILPFLLLLSITNLLCKLAINRYCFEMVISQLWFHLRA